jgi:hypothetical protein
MPGRHRIHHPNPDAELQVALAEFTALRDEILSVRSVQKNVTSIALTAYAVVFSVAYAENGDRSVLLVLPPLGLGLCLVQLGETLMIGRIGRYIGQTVWPTVTQLSGYGHSWEARRPAWYEVGVTAFVADFMLPLLMALAGAVALSLAPTTDRIVVWEVAALIATVLAPIVVGVAWALWGRNSS